MINSSLSPRRILVLRPGALGDLLLTLPVLEALQSCFPRAEIELVGTLPAAALLPGRSVVRRVASLDGIEWNPLFAPRSAIDGSLRESLRGADLVLSYLGGPEHPATHKLRKAVDGQVLSCDPQGVWGTDIHASEYLAQPLADLGAYLSPTPALLRLQPAEQQAAATWLAAQGLAGKRILTVHPGSGSPAKNWPAERMAAVARDTCSRYAMKLLLIGGPADVDAIAALRGLLGATPYVLAQDMALPVLAALLARCSLYLGNDSGVTHLAAAVGTRVVAVFGPTAACNWRPLAPMVRIVESQAACAPCLPAQRRACTSRQCMQSIICGQVLQAVEDLILAKQR